MKISADFSKESGKFSNNNPDNFENHCKKIKSNFFEKTKFNQTKENKNIKQTIPHRNKKKSAFSFIKSISSYKCSLLG